MRRFFKIGKPINWRYAIGEVALIFIGITLALSFSNWNQNRQERQTETKLLRELHANLDETAKSFEGNLNTDRAAIISQSVVIKVIAEELPWNDTLQPHFNRFFYIQDFNPITTTYESLKNWGIQRLSTDSLRQQISNLFENQFTWLGKLEDTDFNLWYGSYQDEITRLLNFENLGKIQPFDHQQFIQKKEFANKVRFQKGVKEFNTNARAGILRQIINLRDNIAKELEQLE